MSRFGEYTALVWHALGPVHMCREMGISGLDDGAHRHLVSECTAFQDLRAAYQHLFGQPGALAFEMRRFIAHDDQNAVVIYSPDSMHRIEP